MEEGKTSAYALCIILEVNVSRHLSRGFGNSLFVSPPSLSSHTTMSTVLKGPAKDLTIESSVSRFPSLPREKENSQQGSQQTLQRVKPLHFSPVSFSSLLPHCTPSQTLPASHPNYSENLCSLTLPWLGRSSHHFHAPSSCRDPDKILTSLLWNLPYVMDISWPGLP